MEKLLWCLSVGQPKGLVVFSFPFFILFVPDRLCSYLLVIQQQLLYSCWEEIIRPFQRKDRIMQLCITGLGGKSINQWVLLGFLEVSMFPIVFY